MGLEIPADETAAVEIDQHRIGGARGTLGPVDPDGVVIGLPLFDGAHLCPLAPQGGRGKIALTPGLPAQLACLGATCGDEVRHHGGDGRLKLCVHAAPLAVYKNRHCALLARERNRR
ncbi:hypothetical protein D3C75_945370 [compost metagenome]